MYTSEEIGKLLGEVGVMVVKFAWFCGKCYVVMHFVTKLW